MAGFIDRIVEAERRIAELERRGRNRKRTGVVAELDLKKGLARVRISDGDRPFLSPWVPWKEIAAGGIKSHIPPTVGEQVDLVSESG
ncbi:phage baseplate assembly protein V, partial [Nitratireductor aquimarinus]